MKTKFDKNEILKYINSLCDEDIERISRLQDEDNKKVYEDFISSLKKNKCFLCGLNLDIFNENSFCFHWFLYPKGIKKRYFENYFKDNEMSFFRLDSYFRWHANSEKPIGNISDLAGEKAPGQFMQSTIKYKNIEWSISISHKDKEGHAGKEYGNFPHYHLQMKVNDRVFLKFNDFHIRFTEEDLFTLAMIEHGQGQVAYGHYKGHGISIIENDENLKIIDDKMTLVDDESTGTFLTQTFVQAPEGDSINGELLLKIIKESKETKVPFRHVIKKYKPEFKITTIINPGEGVPELVKRKGRGRNKKKKV